MVTMTGYIPTLAQVDALHRKISPSAAAYDLIHTHCVIVATIAGELVRHQNRLFTEHRPVPSPGQGVEGAGERGVFLDGASADGTGLGCGRGGDRAAAATPSMTTSAAENGVTGDGVTGGTAPARLLDENLTIIGALLHDIGTYRVLKGDGSDGGPLTFDGPRYILHGLLGYRFLLDEGVDESIAQFARNHTGVGLTREQVARQKLPLPAGDYTPRTLEQEVVMVADKYNSKSIPPTFLTADSYARKAARFGEENRHHWLRLVAQYGEPDIGALALRFRMRVA